MSGIWRITVTFARDRTGLFTSYMIICPFVQRAKYNNIWNTILPKLRYAAWFMAKYGFLNSIRHTGNGLQHLKLLGGDKYTLRKQARKNSP